MATTLQILRKARKLIEKPERWTKGDYAKDRDGRKVPTNSTRAVCYCALGAIQRAQRIRNDWSKASQALADALGGVEVHNWNDAPRRTHAQVLCAFDKAIAAVAKRAP